jgi:hypothetical protein
MYSDIQRRGKAALVEAVTRWREQQKLTRDRRWLVAATLMVAETLRWH